MILELERKLEEQCTAQTEFIVKRTQRVEERLDKKMKDRFNNVPGYHETTFSESLGIKSPILTSDLNDETKAMIRQKASLEDLKTLNDVKTNKVDTELHMRNLG